MLIGKVSLGLVLTTLLALAGAASLPGAPADVGATTTIYYLPLSKGCGASGPNCGNLNITRQKTGAGRGVYVSLYHYRCLGFASQSRYRWIRLSVPMAGKRFHVKVDRPRFKFKLRGRFIGRPGKSSVKGIVSLRNLDRNCGFRAHGFRVRESGTITDPQR